jgi:hypothetical protein
VTAAPVGKQDARHVPGAAARRPPVPAHERRAKADELDDVARAAAALAARPSGGPLGLHAASANVAAARVATVEGVADRMLVGKTREGWPEVRLELAAPGWRGTEVRLVAGRHGLEATLFATTEAARRVVEAQLGDLARALEGRGIHVARCQLAERDEQRSRDDERQRRRERQPAAFER